MATLMYEPLSKKLINNKRKTCM